jgi:hypothetical protein
MKKYAHIFGIAIAVAANLVTVSHARADASACGLPKNTRSLGWIERGDAIDFRKTWRTHELAQLDRMLKRQLIAFHRYLDPTYPIGDSPNAGRLSVAVDEIQETSQRLHLLAYRAWFGGRDYVFLQTYREGRESGIVFEKNSSTPLAVLTEGDFVSL